MSEPEIYDRKPCIMKLAPGNYAWCACGRSAKQPMCDGSHAGTGLVPHRFTIEKEETIALCNCKHTEKPPKCDGSHSKLPL